MLQIKKSMTLQNCKYNLSFLFRKKRFDKLYTVRKQKSSVIVLRAPKHFNIGKQKVLNLNYQTPDLILPMELPMSLFTFLKRPYAMYSAFLKRVRTNPALGVKSVRLRVSTKILLKWLEILYLSLSLTRSFSLLFFESWLS